MNDNFLIADENDPLIGLCPLDYVLSNMSMTLYASVTGSPVSPSLQKTFDLF